MKKPRKPFTWKGKAWFEPDWKRLYKHPLGGLWKNMVFKAHEMIRVEVTIREIPPRRKRA